MLASASALALALTICNGAAPQVRTPLDLIVKAHVVANWPLVMSASCAWQGEKPVNRRPAQLGTMEWRKRGAARLLCRHEFGLHKAQTRYRLPVQKKNGDTLVAPCLPPTCAKGSDEQHERGKCAQSPN